MLIRHFRLYYHFMPQPYVCSTSHVPNIEPLIVVFHLACIANYLQMTKLIQLCINGNPVWIDLCCARDGKSAPSSYSNTSGGPSILRNNNHFAANGSSLTVMHTDIPSFEDSQVQASTELSAIFDPDHVLAKTLLTQLMSATSVSSRDLCQPFLRHGHILTAASTDPIFFDRLLLDTGAQGSNFISAHAYSLIPESHQQSVRNIDKVVRLGDARHLSVQLEVLLL